MIQSRIVETLDENTRILRESVEVTFEDVAVSFYLAGNTECRALATALAAVQSYTVTRIAPPVVAEEAPPRLVDVMDPDDYEHTKEA